MNRKNCTWSCLEGFCWWNLGCKRKSCVFTKLRVPFVDGAIFTELGCCDFHVHAVILRYFVRSSDEKSTYPVQTGGGFNYHGPPKPTFLEGFMVNNLAFRWPKPLFFMVLVAPLIVKYGEIR